MADDKKHTIERVVFLEEGATARVTLVACGSIDTLMLDGLEAYIARQRRRAVNTDTRLQFPDEGIPA